MMQYYIYLFHDHRPQVNSTGELVELQVVSPFCLMKLPPSSIPFQAWSINCIAMYMLNNNTQLPITFVLWVAIIYVTPLHTRNNLWCFCPTAIIGRRKQTHADTSRHTQMQADKHRWTQMHADKHRHMQTNADASRRTQTHADECRSMPMNTDTQTNTKSSVWASRCVQTLDVCSRTFGRHYSTWIHVITYTKSGYVWCT